MKYYDKILRSEFRKLDDGSWKENYSHAVLPFKKEFERSYIANYINDRTCKYLQMPVTYKALDELNAIEERTKSIKVISQFIKDKPSGFTYEIIF